MTDDFEQQVAEHGARLAYESVVASVEEPTEEKDPDVLVDELREEYAQAEADQDRRPTEAGFLAWLVGRRNAETCDGCREILTRAGIQAQRLNMGVPVAGVRDAQALVAALRRQVSALRDVNEALTVSVGAAHQAADAVAALVLEEVEAVRRDIPDLIQNAIAMGIATATGLDADDNLAEQQITRFGEKAKARNDAAIARLDRIASAVQEERR